VRGRAALWRFTIFSERALPCTVAVFAQGADRPSDVGLAEQEAVRLAMREERACEEAEESR
jgi:hypothetical protein